MSMEIGTSQKKSLTASSNISDSFYIKNEKYLTYNSSYLDAANSSSESTIDKFFLQKILSTTPTKFILAIKNIETKNSNSSLVKANIELKTYIEKKMGTKYRK
ncbi:MAG: hypothetical protein AB8U53_02910 [Rickettsia aeschlimannii]